MSIRTRFVPQFIRNLDCFTKESDAFPKLPFLKTVNHGLVAIVDISGESSVLYVPHLFMLFFFKKKKIKTHKGYSKIITTLLKFF